MPDSVLVSDESNHSPSSLPGDQSPHKTVETSPRSGRVGSLFYSHYRANRCTSQVELNPLGVVFFHGTYKYRRLRFKTVELVYYQSPQTLVWKFLRIKDVEECYNCLINFRTLVMSATSQFFFDSNVISHNASGKVRPPTLVGGLVERNSGSRNRRRRRRSCAPRVICRRRSRSRCGLPRVRRSGRCCRGCCWRLRRCYRRCRRGCGGRRHRSAPSHRRSAHYWTNTLSKRTRSGNVRNLVALLAVILALLEGSDETLASEGGANLVIGGVCVPEVLGETENTHLTEEDAH